MKSAIYPGTFDPITLGHINIIERAAAIFDNVVIAVAESKSKTPLFLMEQRKNLISESLQHLPNVVIKSFKGLLVDFANQNNAGFIVRGIRTTADFEFEYQLASMNRKLQADIETLFLAPLEQFACISSSLVKEIALMNGCITGFVTPCVELALKKALKE